MFNFELNPPLAKRAVTRSFSPDDVIYLIMPDRFANGDISNDDPANSKNLYDRQKTRYYHGGDLQGVIDKLPYLKDLGVTAIWLNPWYDNANRLNERETYDGKPIADYHGYGAVDYYGVDEHLGNLAKLQELIAAAHRAGIKVIQDQVANHTGPYHPWVTDSPAPHWYHGTEANHINETWQTWTLIDSHSTPAMQRSTLDGWFINILPDMNQDDPEAARYLIQNTLWWIGMTGIDGIRQDTLPYVPRKFWRDWSAAIHHQYPGFRVVGEVFDADPGLVSFFQGGKTRFDGIDSGIDTVFDFPVYFKIRSAFGEGNALRDVANLLAHDYLYPAPDLLVTFLGLHDVGRFMNEKGATAAGLKLAFTYLMTSRGIPMIYYGDEIGMRGGTDPDNRRDFPGGWPGDSRNAFLASGRTAEENDIFNHVRKLCRLRAASDVLRNGRMTNVAVQEQAWVFTRVTRTQTALIGINNGSDAAVLEFSLGARQAIELTPQLSSGATAATEGGNIRMTLPPKSAEVFFVK